MLQTVSGSERLRITALGEVVMENDSIRASGTDTLVDIWISGKLRAICVTREAIDTCVGFDEAARMTDDRRCEFLRKNLPLVVSAVKARLRDNPDADSVRIEAGHLSVGAGGERRRTERRKSERRKVSKPKEELPHGERRRGERRTSERRKSPKKPG
jgi:hypothetical protein